MGIAIFEPADNTHNHGYFGLQLGFRDGAVEIISLKPKLFYAFDRQILHSIIFIAHAKNNSCTNVDVECSFSSDMIERL